MNRFAIVAAGAAFTTLFACGGDDGPRTDAEFQAQVVADMKANLLTRIDAWLAAAQDLAAAAPTPTGRGWDKTQDAAAIARMKEAWGRARGAYERIEGVIAPLFPDTDTATDARYDDYMDALKPAGDAYLFDGTGVTGMHAIERILWADAVPPAVITFERALPGYEPAAFPATAAEAADFKTKLAAQMVEDVKALRAQVAPLSFDLASAFNGVIDLVAEQVEKVNKAATGEEESRYAQLTMRDLRWNHEGCADHVRIFEGWLKSKGAPGQQAHAAVQLGLARLKAVYDTVSGDAIPQPPATWSSVAPSAADLQTPFGKLWTATSTEADETMPGTLGHSLVEAITLLGFQRQP